MKILHVIPYLPVPPDFGGALRIYHILKHLADNHEVTVVSFVNDRDVELFRKEFPDLKGRVHLVNRPFKSRMKRLIQLYALFTKHSYIYNRALSRKMQENLNELLRKNDFDIVLTEFSTMAFFELQTEALKIVDAHNVEYDNFRRMAEFEWSKLRSFFYRKEYKKCYKDEISACSKMDALFTTSQRDADLFTKDIPSIPKFVIPNGVETTYFQAEQTKIEPYSIVFTGSMNYVPNYDGMLYFIRDIFPLIKKKIPEAKIYVVGNKPPDILKAQASESVVITGFVDDVRPYINRSSVFVVPLRMGGGTRLKVVEALSMKKPIVTTSIGCEGIEVTDEKDVLIEDKPEQFAQAVVRLFRDQILRDKLVANGYQLVKSRYDWSVIGSQMEEAFTTLKSASVNSNENSTVNSKKSGSLTKVEPQN